MQSLKALAIAERSFLKHRSTRVMANYAGILSLEALLRLWRWTGDERHAAMFRETIHPFVNGELTNRMGAFKLYNGGGGPAALALRHGLLPEAEETVRSGVTDLINNVPRSKEGVFSSQTWTTNDPNKVWIDVAFAVCPFLCNAGIHFREDAWVDEAVDQIVTLTTLLRDPKTGLLHQCRGFHPESPEAISEDHWSRGNGWAILALAGLVQDLPENHPRRSKTETLLTNLLTACLNHQDEKGMWRQEITDHDSYVETSGTGLILHALGVALERGLVKRNGKKALIRGLEGYASYIALDGSVHHCCGACLFPGNGTIDDYRTRPHQMNDSHAFGPVTLAFGQAAKIGVLDANNS